MLDFDKGDLFTESLFAVPGLPQETLKSLLKDTLEDHFRIKGDQKETFRTQKGDLF